MKPPYFKITATCGHHGEFVKESKRSQYVSTDGRLKTVTSKVCRCGAWAPVTKIEEVKA